MMLEENNRKRKELEVKKEREERKKNVHLCVQSVSLDVTASLLYCDYYHHYYSNKVRLSEFTRQRFHLFPYLFYAAICVLSFVCSIEEKKILIVAVCRLLVYLYAC
ncbi:hypothetical protein IscW_ISCW011732 [Ixodes scapularis]|uniref:Uncharacterized protein n=1 Tax=Ixodes scapularis TaxID=6945 RepID=B7Q6G5_IXOSC|nr:hypothetical protein IscW_ISCW011732 [Ixodes scapularis]|eukprot:XP_002411959.1 hypothetical protein IscW_ISCW011732 [Ixodes scapularis]